MSNAIEITNVSKTYAGHGKSGPKTALEHIDLNIPKGSMFALLGPNGAGKSTLINILAGLVIKSRGQVTINGFDIDQNRRNASLSIGIVPQEISFDPFFTPRQMLDIQAGYYSVPKTKRRTDEILKMVGLFDKADAAARSLSGGMKRRLMVAKAMVHNPAILVLDEPTAGVDVELRQQLWENVKALNAQGTTVLLTTHYLEEAETLCDRIAIINHGQIIANEDKEALLSRIDQKEIRFRLDREISTMPDGLQGCTSLERKRTLLIRYTPSESSVGQFIDVIQKAGYGITDITTDTSDLEDVFIQLTSNA